MSFNSSPPSTTAPARRVLLVDDQPDILELLVLLFEAAGFDVATAPDGAAGLAAARAAPFDAFVLDVTMPRMDGIELAEALRADAATASVPILFHTSLLESQVRARFTGHHAYLRKPVDPGVLIAAVRSLVGRPVPPTPPV